MQSHLEGLNAAQEEAVLHSQGPLLVLAGAGAGKTRVITHRILELVVKGTAPENILAITFTNKAAREMRERVETLLKNSKNFTREEEMPFISTFHSLGLRIIKEHYREFGFKRFPAIYDRADSLKALRDVLKHLGTPIQNKESLEAGGSSQEARMVLGIISRSKGDGITQELYEEGARDARERMIATAWRGYERALQSEGALDFDDLLLRAVLFLRENEIARKRYQKRWQYLHIDEYQDTNRIQSALVALLVGEAHNICAVGDIDQTIYTWRGADIRNLLSFSKHYPGARTILLEENYRSSGSILEAANALIAKNHIRVEKNLFTKKTEGEPLSIFGAFDEHDEAHFVVRKINERIERGARPKDFAVLYRANFQSRALEEALLQGDIPYQVLGTRFFERAEVKDMLAFLRAALYNTTPDIARIANVPRRGIGKTTLMAMLSGTEGGLRGNTGERVALFRTLLHTIERQSHLLPPSELITFVMRESGVERMLREDKLEGVERLNNIKELIALAGRYDKDPIPEGTHAFLENAALASEQDELKEEANAVRLMTVHASKGLEFPYVFITGLEEGLFPYTRDEMDEEEDDEEERRLMYVALTRAQEKIFLTHTSIRTTFGQQSFNEPSQFLLDIPERLSCLEEPERLGRTIYLE
ncbi:MAG: UvrD-helicase domain-containing protein [Patescibacteria group bacterium]|nr:UvrD-helicase domain-containing protein [Patescibacteria group bacterium]